MNFDFEAQKRAWSTPPVGGRNTAPTDLLGLTDSQLVRWVDATFREHYAQESNRDNRMVELMKMDTTSGKVVLDFGCGFGLDALRYAWAGNEVMLADIAPANLQIASRILQIHGYPMPKCSLVTNEPPFCAWPKMVDVFHANGVLHHSPNARGILQRVAFDALRAGGEIRLMLYTNHLFTAATGIDPRVVFADDGQRARFVRFADAVGDYADWYDKPKLSLVVHGLGLDIVAWDYLRSDQGYAVAILQRSSLAA